MEWTSRIWLKALYLGKASPPELERPDRQRRKEGKEETSRKAWRGGPLAGLNEANVRLIGVNPGMKAWITGLAVSLPTNRRITGHSALPTANSFHILHRHLCPQAILNCLQALGTRIQAMTSSILHTVPYCITAAYFHDAEFTARKFWLEKRLRKEPNGLQR